MVDVDELRASLAGGQPMLIAGELVDGSSGETMSIESPGDGEPIAIVPAATRDDVARAVEAAAEAFPAWRFTDLMVRRQALLNLAKLVRDNAETLAIIDSLDGGSPVQVMRRDVAGAVLYIEWLAGLAFSWGGHTPSTAGGGIDLTLREPYGVTARIIPFNHPLYFACKLAAPLLTGNTVVVKLPDQTPLSGLWLARRVGEIFPRGVVNIITGQGAVAGDALIRHPKVARIAFTGSVPTGRRIMQAAAERFAATSMELGGKNPMIICADADLSQALPVAVAGMNYGTQGQSCGSYSRLFVHESVHEEVVERLAGLVDAVKVGHPLDESSEMGALIDERARTRAESHVVGAQEAGARVVAGGRRPKDPSLAKGWYMRPTVLDGVRPDMAIAREEIFGPVQSVIRWSEIDEVVAAANGTDYGLTANICTRDLDRALYLARRIESGTLSVNGTGAMHWMGAPFGGFKASGLGKEDSLDEIIETTREKNIYLNLRTPV